MTRPVSVLIVDDSITARSLMTVALRQDPQIHVVGTAATALEARDMIIKLQPDVLTLDVEMPQMNGLEFLEKIMRLRPMPVIMVSSHTARGADVAIRALELGAVECFAKPQGFPAALPYQGLCALVRHAASARIRGKGADDRPLAPAVNATPMRDPPLVAIGASTGGVEALTEVLGSYPADCPPTVITQHMPAAFTDGFARRLDRLCAPNVRIAEDLMPVKRGQVLIAPGGAHHLQVVRRNGVLMARLYAADPVNGHRPSVDVLFQSVAHHVGRHAIGVILTGMEYDGARGLLAMRQAGARTLGQDEESSVIYGMPKAAFDLGAVERQLPLDRIAGGILRLAGQLSEGTPSTRSIIATPETLA
jgi:two-component system, chemotaxis family, protein-glutamate methylesterase/glutaminase